MAEFTNRAELEARIAEVQASYDSMNDNWFAEKIREGKPQDLLITFRTRCGNELHRLNQLLPSYPK